MPANRSPARNAALATAGALALSAALAASLWLFLRDPDHRLGGIAWNALAQLFVPPLAIIFALIVAALGLRSGRAGLAVASVLAALALAAISVYCLVRSLPIMMGV